ncbi:MAG: hypothetical protein IKT50_00185 [Clostridia bacterium]|nr:hypothetical protein [Clostridia bacterium]
MKHFFLLSDDPRFDALEKRLSFYSYPVFRALINKFPEESVLVFSLGAKEETVLSAMENAPEGSVVFVGRKTNALLSFCNRRGIRLIPLLENEIYLNQNAAATAEGFLGECIGKTDATLSDQTFLVIGYGNCGKAIAKLLYLCGGEVYVHSHSGSMEKASSDGFSVFPAFTKKLSMFDCIVNTVPAPIFDENFFGLCRSGTHFFQIASGLSGIDPERAKKCGVIFHPLPALPAKYSPVTEGDNLFAALDSILKLSIPPERE